VFVFLSAAHTWPLASNPAHLSRNDNADAVLNTWAMAWVAHQLPRDPLHLFDANIFYPEPYTLAYSEAMLVQSFMAMPILALGGAPVLAHSLVLLAGFALTGWAFCLLLHRWTGSWTAAYAGGSLAAFNSHALVRLAHIQTLHVEFIALMLFAFDRLVTSRRVRDAVWLGVGFALQGLTSMYLLVFSVWMLLFVTLGRATEWLRVRPVRFVGLLAVAGGTASIILAPYITPYVALNRLTGFERTVGDGSFGAGSWVDYLATGSQVHYRLWSQRFFNTAVSATFPGVLMLLFVGLALTWPDTRRDARVRMCLIAAVGCAVASWLPGTEIYPWLHATIPLFRVIRIYSRLGQIVLMLLAVVAAFGVAGLAQQWGRSRWWPAAAVTLVVLVNAESFRPPLSYRPFDRIPDVYDVLIDKPGSVAAFPFFPPGSWHLNARYMLDSTRHWRPLLNGYSGFRPGSYNDTYVALQSFPDLPALAALHERGVTHVIVIRDQFTSQGGPERFAAIERSPALDLVESSGEIFIYQLK
jgi:hypothetical protein